MDATVRRVLDTSVVIARQVSALPEEAAISAATIAELHVGVHLARTDRERRARVRRLAEVEASFDPLPIDAAVARSYGMLAHLVMTAGRQPRRRAMDLLIAATAHTHGVPLYTRDATDLIGLEDELTIRVV
jgi:predicted nucleic acid-binding protein